MDNLHTSHTIIFKDEAWFHFPFWIWSTETPHAPYETPNPVKNGAWFAVYCHRIIQPIFFENTVKSDHYIGIVHGSSKKLLKIKTAEAWF
jgi:hypothetical protein